ncbi:MAG: M13 family metallopeptidase [Neisseriaceae bacterium]
MKLLILSLVINFIKRLNKGLKSGSNITRTISIRRPAIGHAIWPMVVLCGCSTPHSDLTSPLVSADKASSSFLTTQASGTSKHRDSTLLSVQEIQAHSIEQLRAITQEQLAGLFQEISHRNYSPDTDEFWLQKIYRSISDIKGRQLLGLEAIKPLMAKIDALSTRKQMVSFLSEMLQRNHSTPFLHWEVGPSSVAATRYDTIFLSPTLVKFSIQDPLNTGFGTEKNYDNSLKNIEKILEYLKIRQTEHFSKRILMLQEKLQKVELRHFNSTQKKRFYIYSLQQLPPVLVQTLSSFQTKTDHPVHFWIESSNYLNQLEKILEIEPLENLKVYLKYYYFLSYAPYLDEYSYRLAETAIHPQANSKLSSQSLNKQAIGVISHYLPSSLGKLYCSHYFSPKRQQEVALLAKYIQEIFQIRLANNTWLSNTAKSQALNRLKNLKLKIGCPTHWAYKQFRLENRALTPLNLLVALQEREAETAIKKIGLPIDPEEWTMPVFEINARYDKIRNEVVYPAAILQPPFYKEGLDVGRLYGTVGALLAHEMSHALDLESFRTNAEAGIANWPLNDRQLFELKAKTLGEAYQNYAHSRKLKFDTNRTLNEDVADLAGLKIAYAALLKLITQGKHLSKTTPLEPQRNFFLGWNELFKTRDLAYNPADWANYVHSPGPIRALAPLLHFKDFYFYFGISPQDPVYLAPEKRVEIW